MSRLRIVVADQAEAVFYELAPGVHLREVARFEDAAAHGHERDFSSDRPGRTHAPMGEGLRHSFGPEPHARRDAAVRFARAIARVLEEARLRDEWDDLVLFVAGGPFIADVSLAKQVGANGVVRGAESALKLVAKISAAQGGAA